MNALATIEAPAASPLTSADCAALRQADRVVFRHARGVSQIEAIKEKARTARNPFDDEVRVIVAADWKLTDYGQPRLEGYGDERALRFVAFEWCSSAQYDECWQTVAALLKAGDVLTLHWKRDAFRTQNLESVNYHGDGLVLEIERGAKRMSFHIDMSICPDNTARMIRRA